MIGYGFWSCTLYNMVTVRFQVPQNSAIEGVVDGVTMYDNAMHVGVRGNNRTLEKLWA